MKAMLAELPAKIGGCLGWLSWHCNTVAAFSETNNLTQLKLASSFAAVAGLSPELLLMLITNALELFSSLTARQPCTHEEFKAATADLRAQLKPGSPALAAGRKNKRPSPQSVCDGSIPDNDVERMEAEVRAMESALERHRSGIRDKGDKYPAKQMEEMMSIQRQLTARKRSLRAERERCDEEAAAVEDADVKVVSAKDVGLLKQLQELHFQNKELLAIQARLTDQLNEEQGLSASTQLQLDAAAAPGAAMPPAAPPGPEDLEHLNARLEAENATHRAQEAMRVKLCEELIKERAECADIRVQIDIMTKNQPGFKLTRDWDYRCPEGGRVIDLKSPRVPAL